MAPTAAQREWYLNRWPSASLGGEPPVTHEARPMTSRSGGVAVFQHGTDLRRDLSNRFWWSTSHLNVRRTDGATSKAHLPKRGSAHDSPKGAVGCANFPRKQHRERHSCRDGGAGSSIGSAPISPEGRCTPTSRAISASHRRRPSESAWAASSAQGAYPIVPIDAREQHQRLKVELPDDLALRVSEGPPRVPRRRRLSPWLWLWRCRAERATSHCRQADRRRRRMRRPSSGCHDMWGSGPTGLCLVTFFL